MVNSLGMIAGTAGGGIFKGVCRMMKKKQKHADLIGFIQQKC